MGKRHLEPFRFEFSNLERAASQGRKAIPCGRVFSQQANPQAAVLLKQLAPDLMLADVETIAVDYNELSDFEFLGQGFHAVAAIRY